MSALYASTETRVCFWCPGCDSAHCVDSTLWTVDRVQATITPSVLVHSHETLNEAGKALLEAARQDEDAPTPEITDEHRTSTPQCHSFVTAGRIEFLSDSTHALAGQTVGLPEWPIGRD